MASMQCDICGERLTMDVSGEFAICDYCGIKHPKARLMKKVSGISGDGGETKQQFESVSFTPEPAPMPEPIPAPKLEPVQVHIPEPEPIPVSKPEPEVTMENISDIAFQPQPQPQPESFSEPQSPIGQVYSEPVFVSRASSQTSAVGAMDIGMDTEIDSMPAINNNTNAQPEINGMSAAEIAENEKKNSRIEELKAELKEFEEIYEDNKNKFLGEGLKRKNYSETKIKEIKEKLDELGA